MKQLHKRIMSLLLVLGILVSLVPISAAEPEEEAGKLPTVQADGLENIPDSGIQTLAGDSDVTGVYTTWNNATVLAMGQTAEFTLSQYNSSYTAEQIWFKVTVEEDDQAIQMELTDVAYTIYLYVYDEAVLESGSVSSNYEQRFTISSSTNMVSWKADHAGVYYLMLRPYSSGNTSSIPYYLTCSLLEPDLNENNDTWDKATELVQNVNTVYTLNGCNDVDWFRITTTTPGEAIRLVFSNFDYTVDGVSMSLYAGKDLRADAGKVLGSTRTFRTDGAYSYKINEPGDYYVKVTPVSDYGFETRELKLRYEIVPGDANELNDTWQTATTLTENVNTYYTLNGCNDVDWFKITTTVPGEAVRLVFSNFDYTVNPIDARLYSGKTLAQGASSALWSKTDFRLDGSYCCFKANEPGDYYVKIEPHDSTAVVEKALKLRYEIIPGDANELNDSWDRATNLPDNYNMEFTLNGTNDEDWFYFETETANELVYLHFSGFETDYSNRISYAVYDAANGGYQTPALESTNISITHSKAMTFANPGGHYIQVTCNSSTTPVENPLTLWIERGEIDGGEPNDTWQQATPLAYGTAFQFNLPSYDDTDFFTFTTDQPNQTMELTLFIPAGGNVSYRLYSGSELNKFGISGVSYLDYLSSSGSGTRTIRYMLNEAGSYYIRLMASNSNAIFTDNATISYTLIPPDDHEPNDTWQTAAPMNLGEAVSYTLPASNDTDWFKITSSEPDQTVDLTFTLPRNRSISYYLYSGEDFRAQGNNAGSIDYKIISPGTTSGVRCMLSEAGDYYLRVSPYSSSNVFDEDATITYTLVAPDDNERNNTAERATPLREEVDTPYTLPADNDVDWFSFTTTAPDQAVQLDFTIPTGGYISYYLYSAADYEAKGESAAYLDNILGFGNSRVVRHMLSEAGTYYVKLKAYNSDGIFDEDGTISYKLIDPDANERNNTWDAATSLAPQTPVQFTLHGDNDDDYFKLSQTVTAGDHITLEIGNIPVRSDRLYAYLYVVKTGDVELTYLKGWTINNTDISLKETYTAQYDGTYYLEVYPAGGSWVDQPMWFKYAITGDDIDVTGVSITNGGATLAAGQTLQLYANVSPANATNQTVTWESDNPNAATVDAATGLVTAVAPGSTTITAVTADGEKRDSTTIQVVAAVPVTDISIQPEGTVYHTGTESDPQPLTMDTSMQLIATLTPETATNRTIHWTVSDPEVLAVTSKGLVYALGGGTAKVVATSVDGNYTAEYWFNVPYESLPVRGVSLDRSTATLYLRENGLKLTASVSPSYATNQGVTWMSDNPDVATVDQQGNVTQHAVGYATITVKTAENSFTAECLISVQPARTRVQGISFADTSMDLGLYASVTLKPVFTPADATDQTLTWESSNKAVVTVSRTGEVTAIGLGTAEITATSNDGEHKASITVNVALAAGYGDVSNNGTVDAADALLVLLASVGLRTLTALEQEVADVNGDGFVDAADAILILRYNAGLIHTFPVESK